jgi:hypothetical protein
MSDDKVGAVIMLSVTRNIVIYNLVNNFLRNPLLGRPMGRWESGLKLGDHTELEEHE